MQTFENQVRKPKRITKSVVLTTGLTLVDTMHVGVGVVLLMPVAAACVLALDT